MQVFFEVIAGFPTALPTVVLLVVCVYWLLAIAGLVDLDAVDGVPAAEAGHEIGSVGHIASVCMALGLNGVPFSVVVSLVSLITWLVCYLAHRYLLLPLPDLLRYAGGLVALPAGAALALPLTALALRPLRGVFVVHNALRKDHLIGRDCRILTLEVTERFGRAEVSGRGAPYNIRVWARTPNPLGKGSAALILGYDPATESFEVAPFDPD